MTTWVLLRGLIRETRHWGTFPDVCQATLGGTVVALDLPGNGSLWRQDSPASVEAMAEHCRTSLLALGHAPPYRVLALSLGAMVAVAWSARQPQELARMVLLNTSLAPHSPFHQRLRPANYPGLVRDALFGTAARREARILALTSNLRRPDDDQLLARWTAYARECPVSRANMLRQLRAAACFRAPLSAPAVPLLLLASERDRLVDARCSATLARHWGCALVTHPGAGHDLTLDDGEWVLRQVEAWQTAA